MSWLVLALIFMPTAIAGMLVLLHVLDERRERRWERQLEDQTLTRMLKKAGKYSMSDSEREEQRRSFAYGNAVIDNPHVTRAMVDEAADRYNDDDNRR